MTTPFTIRSIQAFCYRYPLTTPVVTSFGEMRDRPALFVRVEDGDGQSGWGEVWCNFPSVGAEHRTRLINEMLAPMLAGRAVTHPSEVFEHLSAATSVLALQSGEPGPFAQSIAAIDIALWDLFAKRAKAPLWRMLGGTSPPHARLRQRHQSDRQRRAGGSRDAPRPSRVQAEDRLRCRQGPRQPSRSAAACRRRLSRRRCQSGLGNRAGAAIGAALEEFNLAWLEEPLRADRPWSEWRSLQKRLTIPLAGGENIAGRENFAAALSEGVLTVVQPDAAKWGGITGCLAVARDVLASKRHYCPHFLGGGIGLLASAHLLAGSGGGGLLEVDSNDNPLREDFCGAVADIKDGEIVLPETPGLGIEPDVSRNGRAYASKPYRSAC